MAEPSPSRPSEPVTPATASRSLAMEFLSMGLGSAICLALGAIVGLVVDAMAHTSPLFTLVGLGLGVVAGILYTVSKVRRNL